MEITWLGHSCIRLKTKDKTLLMDPCGKGTGFTLTRQQADIVTVSRKDDDHGNLDALVTGYKLLDAPGEYEIGGVLINGVQTTRRSKDGEAPPRNVAFVVEVDDLRICHLGDLDRPPSQDLREQLSDIDVLVVPVGGNGTLDSARAAEVISLLEPKVVVPVRYKTEQATPELESIDPFIKQMGLTTPTPQAKLSVTRSNLPETTEVAVLDPRR